MARLIRPYIPLAVRVQVAERQVDAAIAALGQFDPETDKRSRNLAVFRDFVDRQSWHAGRSAAHKLSLLLRLLFGDDQPHLDHDPPLGARTKIYRRKRGEYDYAPNANNPDYLVYREAGAHRLKTNVKGEHGQHPDRVLIKKARRLEKGNRKKSRQKAGSRNFIFSTDKLKPKMKWPKRKFETRRKP
jgi:hypothetical protein